MLLRAAQDLEQQARYVENGWESEITLGIDASFPFARLLPLIDEFYRQHHHTRLRFSHEVLAGSRESLVYGCAGIIIGAICEPPSRVGYAFSRLGQLDYVFAVAPQHRWQRCRNRCRRTKSVSTGRWWCAIPRGSTRRRA